jgi:hypothetical protein
MNSLTVDCTVRTFTEVNESHYSQILPSGPSPSQLNLFHVYSVFNLSDGNNNNIFTIRWIFKKYNVKEWS